MPQAFPHPKAGGASDWSSPGHAAGGAEAPSHPYCTDERVEAQTNVWPASLNHPAVLKDSTGTGRTTSKVLTGPPPGFWKLLKVCQERRKRSKPPHMVTLPQGWKFPGCQQRAASPRPSDLLALLFENQSRKGQRSSRHTPPTPAAGAIFNLLSLLGSPLRDLPMAVLHSYPLTQGGASHT